jgi:hypothetical protein
MCQRSYVIFASYCQACVCIHKVDWKDNRNISLKGSSAQILILKSTNSQKYIDSKLYIFLWIKSSQTPHGFEL